MGLGSSQFDVMLFLLNRNFYLTHTRPVNLHYPDPYNAEGRWGRSSTPSATKGVFIRGDRGVQFTI